MTRTYVASLGLAGVLLIAAACDGPSATPTAPTVPTTPVQPQPPQVREVTVSGTPSVLYTGATAALHAIAQYTDGTAAEVTSQATWRSSDAACQISDGGTLTASSAGISEITAEYSGVRSVPIRVTCGFVITIRVHENAPTEHIVLAGVAGEVVEGPLTGYTFVTDEGGRAVLPPVSGPGTRMHFRRDGYENLFYRVTELPRDTDLDVALVPVAEPVTFFGRCYAVEPVWASFPFTTSRAGLIRVTYNVVESGNPWMRGHAWVYEDGRVIVEANADGTRRFDTMERQLPAGSYRLEYSYSHCGVTGTVWRVTLERPR